MIVLFIILFVWLILLQIKVEGLQDRLEQLAARLPKPTQEAAVITPQNDTEQKEKVCSTEVNKPVSTNPYRQKWQARLAARTHSRPTTPPPSQPQQTALQPQESASKPSFEITAAKLFSWIGGFMLFLGCVFGIKYIVENNLLSPAMRILLSGGAGLTLAVVGDLIQNKKYRILSHTFLGSGIAIVYAAIFCAHTFYHFMSLSVAFICMAVISFVALAVSLQKDTKYIGYLGAIIAFLTPILLNNGSGAWVAFFLYVFCINAAAAYAAEQKGWNGLLICTLSFTWLSQAIWLFPLANYKMLGVVTFFSLYALAATWLVRRHQIPSVISYAIGVFLSMGLLLMLPVGINFSDLSITNTSSLLIVSLEFLGYVVLVNTLLLILTGKKQVAYSFAWVAKVLSFLILCTWMFGEADCLPLWLSLGACVLFTALNSGVELLLFQQEKKPDFFSLIYPIFSMGILLILSVLAGHGSFSTFICFFIVFGVLLAGVLLLAVLAHILWIACISLGLLFVFLAITLVMGLETASYLPLVLLSGLVPLFLCIGMFWALRKKHLLDNISLTEQSITAATALTPFVLILTVLAQTEQPVSIHWLLGGTWVVCLLTILVARLYKNTFTFPAAAIGSGIVQIAVWNRFVLEKNPGTPDELACWTVALLALFIVSPFLCKKYFWHQKGPWIACVLIGLVTCLTGYLLVSYTYTNIQPGLIPAVLLGIYAWLLYRVWGPSRQPQAHPLIIGWVSGAVLFFLTILFPLQIHTQWLAVAWALEAVCLAYLYQKLPYKGWQIASAGLLGIISVWLLLGGDFSPLPDTRIWNWYLWIYGICAIAMLMSATLWEKTSEWKKVFYALFGCLLFWLLNIEIAHWFTGANQTTLHFNFTGEVSQALTYTLSWALFSVCTIGIGLWIQKNTVSKAGIVVMSLALLKFFLSDIWQLQAIYRILGLFGLAIMLIITSFWYQKRQRLQ